MLEAQSLTHKHTHTHTHPSSPRKVTYLGYLEVDMPAEELHRSLQIAAHIINRFPLKMRQKLQLG